MIKQVIGHDIQRTALANLALQAKLPHALVFAGSAGIGKFQTAIELAQLLACRSEGKLSPCLSCECCKLFSQSSYPDLHIIECANREQAAIDNIRQVLKRLQLTRFHINSNRIAIFRDAEYLSIQAANLLLKSVEEPASSTFYILITQNAARLPATLRSRCQPWFFNSLSIEQLKLIYQANTELSKHSQAELEKILLLADGSAESLESFSQHSQSWQELQESLDRVSGGDGAYAISYAQALAGKKDSLKNILRLMRIYLGQKLRNSHNYPRSQQSVWAVAMTNIISAERLIFERNLSAASVLSYTLLALARATDFSHAADLPNSKVLLEQIVVG